MRKRIALWAFVAASVALTVWGVVILVNPTTSCRGEEMGPGDVCHYSSPTNEQTDQVQTYEERIATVRQQVPFIIGLGVAMTAFGIYVAARDARSGHEGHGAVDDPVLLHEGDLRDPVVDEVTEEER